MWAQETLWVKRNEQGVIVGVSDRPPKNEDFVPTVPRPARKEKATAATVTHSKQN